MTSINSGLGSSLEMHKVFFRLVLFCSLMVILSSSLLRVKHILGILIYCSYGILLKLMPSHGFYNWPRVCPRPWAQLWRKMHWKNQSFFLLAGGLICFPFFRCGKNNGPWAKIEEIRKSSKFSLASLFDAIKILGFFDLNRWWIQEETAPQVLHFWASLTTSCPWRSLQSLLAEMKF